MKQQSKNQKAKAVQRRLAENYSGEQQSQESILFQQTHIRYILPFLEHQQILSLRLVNKHFCQLINGIYTFLCCNIRETNLSQFQQLADSFCRAEHIVLPNIFDKTIKLNIQNRDQVKSIEFHFNEFDKTYLEQFLAQFPQLSSLLFDQIHCIKKIGNIPIFETLSQLDLQGIYDMSADLTILNYCKMLTSLSIKVHQTQSFFQKLNEMKVNFKLKQFKCRLWGSNLLLEEEKHLQIFLQNQQSITQIELQNDIWKQGEQRLNIFNMFLNLPSIKIFNLDLQIVYLKNILINEIENILFKNKLEKLILQLDTRGEKNNFALPILEYLTVYTRVLDLTNLSKFQFEEKEYYVFNEFYEIQKKTEKEVKILLPNDFDEVKLVSLGQLQIIKHDSFKSIMNIHREYKY